jgi:ankyrin repeat protein
MMTCQGTPRILSSAALIVIAAALVSCDTPQKIALRELARSGVEASGISLLEAVEQRDLHRAALLLEAGVHTGHRDSRGRSPLEVAVENRQTPLVMMLLNSGANVNAAGAGHSSLLGIAAAKGDLETMNLLLAAGARGDGLMPDGEKVLPWAIRQGRLDLVRALMKTGSDPHLKDRHGNPLLHIAMDAGRRDLMETLIGLGADAGSVNAAGETTIHLALRHGWTDAIPKLASAGADPNAHGPNGRRLLEQAVAANNLEKTALFLRIGADPNLPCLLNETTTPLEMAFQHPNPELFGLFLHHGVKPPDGAWDSWLWRAFENRDCEKARLLLSHGAQANRPGPDGLLPVEAALLAGESGFVKLLLDYGAPAGRALWLACQRGDHELASLLLASGISPDATRFPSRDTPLAVAIRGRHDRVAELLLRHGADNRLLSPEGQSLFHLAVATGCPLTVKQLLDMGADPNAPFHLPVSPAFLKTVRPGVMRWVLKTDRNATPVMLAADSGNIQTTRYLIAAGAKTQVRTRSAGLWPINFASRRGDVRMMRLFLGQDPLREERRIDISLSEQRARLFDAEGKELLSTKVSTGRKGYATPTGEFVITNKHRDWTSTLYHASMPYFQRLSCSDFGLHQGNVPGYPASHGCIRVPAGTAAKLFAMTQTGDRVRILP